VIKIRESHDNCHVVRLYVQVSLTRIFLMLFYIVNDNGNDNGNVDGAFGRMNRNLHRKKRVTIKRVAQEAGVSTQTVSRVINNRPDVAPDTRQRIKEIIDRLGYHPSAVARSLIRQRSYTLGVVTFGLQYVGPSRTLNGITFQAESKGYALLLNELAEYEVDDFQSVIQGLLARQVDGIIWAVPEVGENLAWLKEVNYEFPIPILFLTIGSHSGISAVAINNYEGGCMATQYLLEQGYRSIGHITGPLDWWEARRRMDGWRDRLESAGISVSDLHWVEGTWSSASGERGMRRLLEQYPEMDAVFVANDQMALGVLKGAHDHQIEIPDDLGIVGFDGIPESAYFWPPLTTIHQDQHQLGCLAVDELVTIIDNQNRPDAKFVPKRILLDPELIVRASTLKENKSWV
jgi:LacI family transcriptional regulator